MQLQTLPVSWVERIFSRFSAAWGSQKVASMFPEATHGEVKELWARQLGRFSKDTIRDAVENVISGNREWPPSLGEFLEVCRQASVARQQHATVKLLDLPRTSADQAHANVDRIKSLMQVNKPKPGREWAYKVLSRAERGDTVPMAVRQMAEKAIA